MSWLAPWNIALGSGMVGAGAVLLTTDMHVGVVLLVVGAADALIGLFAPGGVYETKVRR